MKKTMLKIYILLFLVVIVKTENAQFNFENLRRVIEGNGKINASIAMMFDSSAKFIPNGIFKGNFYNFGSYDECLGIEDKMGGINGKYCYTTVPIEEVLKLLRDNNEFLTAYRENAKKKKNLMVKLKPKSNDSNAMGFHFGVCIPNSLSADFLNENIPELVFSEDLCYTNEKKLETKHWIALAVLAVFAALAVASTVYDVIVSFSGKESHKALSAFSIYTNTKKLLKSSKNEDQLLCINGLRTLNMMWVVAGHVYVNFLLSGAIDNWKDAFDWMDEVGNMVIMGATLSVDSFFTIAGLLTVYIYMKRGEVEVKENLKAVPMMYLHRYLRLTPALAILVLVYSTGLIKFLGNGPRWGHLQQLAVEGCEQKWWATLFYFQNYMDSSEPMCIDQSWYLSVDMQLFLLSPLILIPLKKWPKSTLAALFTLTVLGVAIPFYIGYSNKFTGLVMGSISPTFTKAYYFKTHARFGPYVIGMIAGYIVHKMKGRAIKSKLHIIFSLVLWVVAIGALIATVFDGFKLIKDDSNAVLDGLFVGFNRNVWALAIALIIVLCVSGNGGFVNTFLSLPIMQLLSKLSYSMYLVHYLIITVVNLSRRDTMHFSNYEAIFQFFSFFILTFLVSVVYTLLFESPILILERLLFSKLRK